MVHSNTRNRSCPGPESSSSINAQYLYQTLYKKYPGHVLLTGDRVQVTTPMSEADFDEFTARLSVAGGFVAIEEIQVNIMVDDQYTWSPVGVSQRYVTHFMNKLTSDLQTRRMQEALIDDKGTYEYEFSKLYNLDGFLGVYGVPSAGLKKNVTFLELAVIGDGEEVK